MLSTRVIPVSALQKWSENLYMHPELSRTSRTFNSTSPPFKICPLVNEKILLVLADPSILANLKIDAIALSIHDKLSRNLVEPTSQKILKSIGVNSTAKYEEELHTGEVAIRRSGRSYCRCLLQTVDPKYTKEYEIAAENALHKCYRNCLSKLLEKGFRSFALTVLYTKEKKFPREQAAHIAVRTLRRFLELHYRSIDSVVLYLENESDLDIYKRLLTLYCPRNERELELCMKLLPAKTCNELGEPVIEERKIRIAGGNRGNTPSISVDPSFAQVRECPAKSRKREEIAGEENYLKIGESMNALFGENLRIHEYLKTLSKAK